MSAFFFKKITLFKKNSTLTQSNGVRVFVLFSVFIKKTITIIEHPQYQLQFSYSNIKSIFDDDAELFLWYG